ncbi:hypothetical protein CTAYLR_001588 [Chrysophaeum taylorii]|uniref:Uncharacterized protein n=1 Tax=Chrysophaeum taylorii TaxID=2483200 RepID=A0AAD7XP22_9STRA|nr:hypothetical protein CTAYLR_001588 [Chrysophaeum taylorii]
MPPPAKPPRLSSGYFALSGYDGLVRCRVEVKSESPSSDLEVSEEVLEVVEAPIDELDPDVTALCRSELERLEAARRADEMAKAQRAEARREAQARRERAEADAQAAAERQEAQRAADAERERKLRIEQARREVADRDRRRANDVAREQAHLEDARQRAEARRAAREAEEAEARALQADREATLRLDESYAKRIAVEGDHEHDDTLARLKDLTGQDDQTCRFFLDCAGGDLSQAFQIWEQSRA